MKNLFPELREAMKELQAAGIVEAAAMNNYCDARNRRRDLLQQFLAKLDGFILAQDLRDQIENGSR